MPRDRFRHFAAIDWSGAVGERQRGIAVAICATGTAAPELVRAGHVWSRAEVLAWLTDEMPSETLVGVDLGPSLPFVDRGAFFPGWPETPPDARSLWATVEQVCAEDLHLAANAFVDHPELARHFRRHGNRTGDLFGIGRGRLRRTEEAQRTQGLNPSSGLNLVGAAQVGKASLTGMRVLYRLDGIVPIWPFDTDPGAGSLLVEVYTSIAALAAGRPRGRSKMTCGEALDVALAHPRIASKPFGNTGPMDDHKTDAILTAAWLRTVHRRLELWHPPVLSPIVARTEGWTFGVT